MNQQLSRTLGKEKVREDVVKIHVCLTKITSSDKKYKDTKMKEIISAFCALFNTSGGKLVLPVSNETDKDKFNTALKYVRMIEQRAMDIFGTTTMVSNITFEKSDTTLVLCIKKTTSFTTVSYNLYLPGETQVVPVAPTEQEENVKAIMKRYGVLDGVKLGSHKKEFIQGQTSGLHENKMIQFRNLKASSSKCVTIADRIVNKSNKFTSYVSAFANHNGGHIYHGIKDDGTVEGERISKDGINEIIRKVEKTMNKMIWPGQPRKGENWEIYFPPVLDGNSLAIPSTYVVVVYIAPFPGGVFTAEPESYEVLDGKVTKIRFTEWKRRLINPGLAVFSDQHRVSSGVSRCTWSSERNERLCNRVNTLLMTYINNGNWKDFERHTRILEETFANDYEGQLAVMSKKVTAYYRMGYFAKATSTLKRYKSILPRSQDPLIFEVICRYLQAALERCKGNFVAAYEIVSQSLGIAEQIPPGLITASFYSLAATLQDITKKKIQERDEKPEILSIKALEHLQSVDESHTVRTEVEQKTHINLAMVYLGCSLSGQLVTKSVEKECLGKATSSLMAVSQTVCEGYALSRFREVQFNLAQSIFHYKLFHLDQRDKQANLKAAISLSKKAENLARDCQFEEMVRYSQLCTAYCTENLVRLHFLRRESK